MLQLHGHFRMLALRIVERVLQLPDTPRACVEKIPGFLYPPDVV
jgi:hypothetical protein